jgi:hypothetical protein
MSLVLNSIQHRRSNSIPEQRIQLPNSPTGRPTFGSAPRRSVAATEETNKALTTPTTAAKHGLPGELPLPAEALAGIAHAAATQSATTPNDAVRRWRRQRAGRRSRRTPPEDVVPLHVRV